MCCRFASFFDGPTQSCLESLTLARCNSTLSNLGNRVVTMRIPRQCCLVATALFLLANCAAAQGRPRPDQIPARALISGASDSLATGSLIAAFRSAGLQPNQKARTDSLADAVVAIAKGPRSDRSAAALTAIVDVGSKSRRDPYSKSFALLIKLHQQGLDAGVRAVALERMIEVGPVDSVLAIWRTAAVREQPDPAFRTEAEVAVDLLCSLGGEKGRRILRDLNASGAVREPFARTHLAEMVSVNFQRGCPK